MRKICLIFGIGITITITSQDEINAQVDSRINLYPVLTNEYLHIQSEGDEAIYSEIFLKDISGRLVNQMNASGNLAILDLKDCTDGIYFLEFYKNNELIDKRKVLKSS